MSTAKESNICSGRDIGRMSLAPMQLSVSRGVGKLLRSVWSTRESQYTSSSQKRGFRKIKRSHNIRSTGHRVRTLIRSEVW